MQRAVRAFALERFALSRLGPTTVRLTSLWMVTGYAGRETAAPEIPAKPTPAISMASALSTFMPASSRTLHSSLGVPRLEIMIAQDRNHRNSHGGANIGAKCLCFVGEPVFGEIAAKQQYISAAGKLGKCFV